LAGQRSQAADALTAAETRRSDAEAAQAKAEAAVGPARERLTRNQQRVDEGRLDAKALSSMVEEIEHLKGRISDLEDVELAAMETSEQAEAEVVAAAGRVQAVAAELQAKVAERDAVVDEAKVEMRGLRARRHAAVADLPADLVALYERLRDRYNGVGVGELKGQRCTGCGLEATTADYNRYLAASPDEVMRCAECERILVRAAA
jgi:predicted  nucleic acid-binding Zn-ribbon protein